jgi:DNA (cytosine-5)-methyltransferase 1
MKSIELFAGAGGLAFGTAEAGFHHKIVIEWDANACATLRRNRDDKVRHVRDWDIIGPPLTDGNVSEFDFTPYRDEADFVCGGPPCQPFSLGGKHRGRDDHRNMFPHAVRAVREVRPKAFVFENVKGLLRKTFANYYSYIIHQLRYPTVTPRGDEDWTHHLARLERLHTSGEQVELGYNVVYQMVNAVDYGVPQHRWRVFIVGIRSDLGGEFSFPQPTHEEDALLYAKWISGEYWDRHRIAKGKRPPMSGNLVRKVESLRSLFPNAFLQPWLTVRDAISDLPRIAVGERSTKVSNHFSNPGARSYAGHTGSPCDEPAKALKAGDHGVPGGENMLRMDDDSVRYFSVRECARLQTFPDEWTFEGSWTESMRQLGNAVPVRLAEQVARPLVATIQQPARSVASPSKRR